MLMAGLYESVVLEGDHKFVSDYEMLIDSEGETEPLWTFTIVTTAANKEFEWLHDRQPVILSTPESLGRWLDTSSQEWAKDLDQLVLPYHDTASPLDWYVRPSKLDIHLTEPYVKLPSSKGGRKSWNRIANLY